MHLRAYRPTGRARPVAVCDPDAARREAVATEYGLRAYATAAEMLSIEKPDLVHITTPPSVRTGPMAEVSAAGTPACTVEKPLAIGVTDWKEIGRLSERTGTRFAVCHQFRWHEDLVRCRKALSGGAMGAVRILDLSAGMNIANQGTHILDYGMALNGDTHVVRVFGETGRGTGGDPAHPGPDNCSAVLEFANGARGVWVTGETAPRIGDPATTWQHVRVAAFAERGWVEWQEFGRWTVISPEGSWQGDYGGTPERWEEKNLVAQAAFHDAVFDWMEDPSRVPGTNLAQSLHEWKVVLALYHSSVTGKPVDVASFDPPDDFMERLDEHLGVTRPPA